MVEGFSLGCYRPTFPGSKPKFRLTACNSRVDEGQKYDKDKDDAAADTDPDDNFQ